MIVRATRPDTGFLIVRNEVVRDERLSYRARGILTFILSQPDNWQTSAERIAAHGKEGRDAVRAAFTELRTAGYMVTDKITDPDTGQHTSVTYVFDAPRQPALARLPLSDPESGFQSSETRTSGTRTPDSQAPLEEHQEGLELSEPALVPVPAAARFEEFWDLYPHGRRVSKKACAAKWVTATKTVDPELIIAGLRRRVAYWNREQTPPQWIKTSLPWLSQGCWDDDVPEPQVERPQGWMFGNA